MSVFGNNNEQRKQNDPETIIGPSVKVDGKFFGKGNVVVQGQVAGSMKTNEDLHIDQGAIVKASIEGKNIVIAGEVHGNVRAQERLELTSSAKVFGDVDARTISIGAGAILNGKCTMAGETPAIPEDDRLLNKQKTSRRAELPV